MSEASGTMVQQLAQWKMARRLRRMEYRDTYSDDDQIQNDRLAEMRCTLRKVMQARASDSANAVGRRRKRQAGRLAC
jgi:hypothetical protein